MSALKNYGTVYSYLACLYHALVPSRHATESDFKQLVMNLFHFCWKIVARHAPWHSVTLSEEMTMVFVFIGICTQSRKHMIHVRVHNNSFVTLVNCMLLARPRNVPF